MTEVDLTVEPHWFVPWLYTSSQWEYHIISGHPFCVFTQWRAVCSNCCRYACRPSLSGLFHGADHLFILSRHRLSQQHIKGSYHQKQKGEGGRQDMAFGTCSCFIVLSKDNFLFNYQLNNQAGRIQHARRVQKSTVTVVFLDCIYYSSSVCRGLGCFRIMSWLCTKQLGSGLAAGELTH